MQERGMVQTSGMENTDLELLINHANLFIYEHQYVEFLHPYIVPHINRLRDNANAAYYILEGGGWIEDCHGKTPIEPGHIYIHPCMKDEDYISHFLPGCKKVYLYFYFDLFSCDDVFSNLRGFRCIKDVDGLIPKIKDAVLSDSISKQLMLPGLVMQSILPLFKEMEDCMKERLLLGKRFHFLFDYLEHNLSHALTLEQISQQTGISYSSLTHTIPKKFGFNIKQYIQRKILRGVSFDLEYTDMRIKDIAEKYGFSSEVYFSDWFCHLTDLRPREYRKLFLYNRNQEDYSLYFEKNQPE